MFLISFFCNFVLCRDNKTEWIPYLTKRDDIKQDQLFVPLGSNRSDIPSRLLRSFPFY